jgi:hypothetical protein
MKDNGPIALCRCRNKPIMDGFLSRDYYDSLRCCFPRGVTRAAAIWPANSQAIFFFVTESSSNGVCWSRELPTLIWRRESILLWNWSRIASVSGTW